VNNIGEHNSEEHITRIKKDQHPDGHDEDDGPHAPSPRTHSLKTRKAKCADHQHAQYPDQKHQ